MMRRGRNEGVSGGFEAIMPLRALGLAVLVSVVSSLLACAGFRGYGAGVGVVHRDKVNKFVVVCVCELSARCSRWTSGWHARARPPGMQQMHTKHKCR